MAGFPMMTSSLAADVPIWNGGSLFQGLAVISDGMNATRAASRDDEDTSADPGIDAVLVAATLGGDDGAFGDLVRRHKSRIFGMATRFARDAHEREDLCQEIFIQAYRKLRDFRGESPFGHWLGRLAVRKCYDLLRNTRRERTSEVSLDDALHAAEDQTTARNRQAREARETLGRALAALPADDWLVITLLELEDIPVREIAGLTGWSETNVRTRAYRARTALKKTLEQQGVHFP